MVSLNLTAVSRRENLSVINWSQALVDYFQANRACCGQFDDNVSRRIVVADLDQSRRVAAGGNMDC
jgi:hypothetical protein